MVFEPSRTKKRNTFATTVKRVAPHLLAPLGGLGLVVAEMGRRKFAKRTVEQQAIADEAEANNEPVPEGIPGKNTNAIMLGIEALFLLTFLVGGYYSWITVDKQCHITRAPEEEEEEIEIIQR